MGCGCACASTTLGLSTRTSRRDTTVGLASLQIIEARNTLPILNTIIDDKYHRSN